MNPIINIKKLSRDLVLIEQKLLKTEDIATTRALNIVVGQGRTELVNAIVEEYDYPKNSIKRRIKPIKATRNDKSAGYYIRSSRPGLAKPRKLKKGISHVKIGRRRTKVTHRIRAGATRPFLVTATAGTYGTEAIIISGAAKKVAVYRKGSFKGGTTTMLGSSVPRMAKKVGIDDRWLFGYIKENFPGEYKKQLKKAKYR